MIRFGAVASDASRVQQPHCKADCRMNDAAMSGSADVRQSVRMGRRFDECSPRACSLPSDRSQACRASLSSSLSSWRSQLPRSSRRIWATTSSERHAPYQSESFGHGRHQSESFGHGYDPYDDGREAWFAPEPYRGSWADHADAYYGYGECHFLREADSWSVGRDRRLSPGTSLRLAGDRATRSVAGTPPLSRGDGGEPPGEIREASFSEVFGG